MAVVAAGFMAVPDSTVAAGPTGEAIGNCYGMLNSHVNGWQQWGANEPAELNK